jgi:vacuolar protein-sorting-associated protein 4
MKLTTLQVIEQQCKYCGSVRLNLFDVPSERLRVPLVCFSDFEKALSRSRSSVNAEELTKFIQWTTEFGMEG